MSEKTTRKNPFKPFVNYFKDVRSELKKVVWPTYKQIQRNTIVVLICVLIVGAFIWILDFGFSKSLGGVVTKYNVTDSTETPNTQQGLPGGVQIPTDGATQGGAAGSSAAGQAQGGTSGDAVNE